MKICCVLALLLVQVATSYARWDQFVGKYSWISISDGGRMFGCSSTDKKLNVFSNFTTPMWTPDSYVPYCSRVDVGAAGVWYLSGTGTGKAVFEYLGPKNAVERAYLQKSVAVGKDVYILSSEPDQYGIYTISKYSRATNLWVDSGLPRPPVAFSAISTNDAGEMWALDEAGNPWQVITASGKWQNMGTPTPLKTISVGRRGVYVTSIDAQTFQFINLGWVKITDAPTVYVDSGSEVVAIDQRSDVWKRYLSPLGLNMVKEGEKGKKSFSSVMDDE